MEVKFSYLTQAINKFRRTISVLVKMTAHTQINL